MTALNDKAWSMAQAAVIRKMSTLPLPPARSIRGSRAANCRQDSGRASDSLCSARSPSRALARHATVAAKERAELLLALLLFLLVTERAGGMRCVVQRVKSASVTVDGEKIATIGRGLCVLVGLEAGDAETPEGLDWMAKKITNIKFFEGEDGRPWKRSVKDLEGGEVLLVSQFTLYYRYKGTNLDFSKAMPPEAALEGYNRFVEHVGKELHDPSKVKEGRFGAQMDVDICNDGPVTMQIEFPEPKEQKKS